MERKITRVRTDVRNGVVTLTAFGPSVKGRTKLVAQVKEKDGDPGKMLTALLEKMKIEDDA